RRRRLPRPPLQPRAPGPASTRSLVLLEAQPLMVEPVSELIPLGGQIPAVLLVRRHFDRNLFGHLEPERLEARDLFRVVREQPDLREPELGEDLVADPPLALVGREAER